MFLSLNSEIFFSIQMSLVQCQSQFDVTRWLYSRSSQQWQRIEWLMFFFSAETSHHNWKLSSIPPLSNRNHCRNISCLKNPRAANFSKWTWWNMSHHHHVFLGWLFVGNCSMRLKIVSNKTLASQKKCGQLVSQTKFDVQRWLEGDCLWINWHFPSSILIVVSFSPVLLPKRSEIGPQINECQKAMLHY